MSEAESHQGTRRDFIYYATASAGAVVTGAAAWPLINQMNPSADVLALSSIRQDISAIQPGSQATILFQGKPVFIRRRNEDEIALAAEQDAALDSMPDQLARNENLAETTPATDANRTMPVPEGYNYVEGEWLVQSGVCTHLGCVPVGNGSGDFGGWFCPCHGSHYDASGRIRKGPAPENLPIPVAVWIDETTIQLGEESS